MGNPTVNSCVPRFKFHKQGGVQKKHMDFRESRKRTAWEWASQYQPYEKRSKIICLDDLKEGKKKELEEKSIATEKVVDSKTVPRIERPRPPPCLQAKMDELEQEEARLRASPSGLVIRKTQNMEVRLFPGD